MTASFAGTASARTPFKVAAIQMVSGPEVAANLAEAGRLLAQAAELGARLAVLPEFFAIMGLRDTDKIAVRESPGFGPIQDFLVYDAEGRLAGRYDKIHLFGFDNGHERFVESNSIEPGSEVVAIDSPFGRIGLSVCYDLRFPELYRRMGPVDLILVPSAFTATTGKAHWEILLRARAIENLAYVLAPAQGGVHPSGRETHGDTMVVDPWGEVLARVPRGPGVAVAECDPARIAAVRTSLPALEHRTLVPI
jgi:nitrilase